MNMGIVAYGLEFVVGYVGSLVNIYEGVILLIFE